MDLAFTDAQQALATTARAAFRAGDPPPIVEGAVTDLAVVATELGRAAVPSRFHTDVLARLLGWRGGGPVAVAVDGPRLVPHAVGARTLLVCGEDSVTEHRLDPGAVTPRATIGDDDRGDVDLGRLPDGERWTCDVEAATTRAAVVLAADAVGAATAALEAATAHVLQRHQWGRSLAALQAVQHRCADMLLDVTMASDAVFDAAGVADRATSEHEVRLAAAYAKASAIERCRRVTASAHQLAGGRGIAADAPFHRWYRRVKAAEPTLGDARTHREIVARALLGRS